MTPVEQQTILITGTTSGLGRDLARAVAASGATVLLHGRDEQLGAQVCAEISQATGNRKLRFYVADLASLRETADLAQKVTADHDRLDALVNNAAVGFGRDRSRREVSRDGYELRLAVNYLAPYVLTRRLSQLLLASKPARIVNVASVGQESIDFDDLQFEHGYDGVSAYRRSKLALIAWTFRLAEHLRESGVTVNAVHPASLMPTKMVLEAGWKVMSTVAEGLAATLRLVEEPELDRVSGEYFEGIQPGRAKPQAYDPGAQARLEAVAQELAGRVLG